MNPVDASGGTSVRQITNHITRNCTGLAKEVHAGTGSHYKLLRFDRKKFHNLFADRRSMQSSPC